MMKKILVVEDDEFLLDAYKAKLEKGGNYQIDVARDGEEALTKVSSFKPDLIILDLILPKKNGLEVLKELQANEATKNIAVIIASNIDQKDTVKEGLQLGAKEYFVKSNISINELREVAAKYLK